MQLDTTSHHGCVIQTSTVAECLELVHRRVPGNHPNVHTNSETDEACKPNTWRYGWVGGDCDIRNAVDWPKGRDLMAKYECQLVGLPKAESIVRRRRWSEDGDEFSRDRFDAGYAECWASRKRTMAQREGGVLRISVNIGCAANQPASNLVWIGAAACLLVDRLEDVGYRVEVEVMNTNKGMFSYKRDKQLTRMMVKQAQDPLDLDTLLMACSCPWFFRVHIFRLWCEQPWAVTGCKGRNASAPEWAKGDIHLERVWSLAEAQAQLGEILKRFEKEGDMQCVA